MSNNKNKNGPAASAPAAPAGPTAEAPEAPKVEEVTQAPGATEPAAETPPADPAAETPPAETPPAEPTPPAANEERKAVGVKIRSKVGLIIHPFKAGARFTDENPIEFVEVDSWLQAQIDAGKLEIVE